MKKILIILAIIFILTSCNYKINNINDNNVTLSGTNNSEKSININNNMIINNKVDQNNLLYGSIKQNKIISNTGAEVFNNKNKSTIIYSTGSKLYNYKIKDLLSKKINTNYTINDISTLEKKGIYPVFNITKDLIKSQLVQKYLNLLKDYSKVYKKNDLLITKNNEKLFLKLFKSKILPSFFHKKVLKKDIFYTIPYSDIKGLGVMIDNGKAQFNCGEGSRSGGELSSVCIIIVKDGDNYYIDSSYNGIFIVEDKKGNLLFSNSSGGGCAIVSKYNLTDFKLNKIGSITNISGGCQSIDNYYKKDNKAISFDFYTNKINSSGFIGYKKGDFNMINYYSGSELYKQEVYLKSVYNFDISENILNNGFTFEINKKKKVLDINNIKNYKKISIFNNIINLSLEKDNTGIGDYNLIGFFEVGLYNDFKKIEVLSCKNNTKFYDNTWYTLKKFDKNSGRFLYRISEKFGNKCDIPYKIRYYLNNNNKEKVVESEYNLVF